MKQENQIALKTIIDFMNDDDLVGNLEWLLSTVEAMEKVEDGSNIYTRMLIHIRGFAQILDGVKGVKDTPKIEA